MNRNNDTARPMPLEQVLDEYVMAVGQPDHTALVEWVARLEEVDHPLRAEARLWH